MLRSFAPVPWVPVEIAPAIVWRSMSPRFSIASPSPCSSSLSSASTVPAPTLTRPEAGSASITPLSGRTSTIVPSVIAASVKEWPEPATLTLRPAATAAADRLGQLLAIALGRTSSTGVQGWSPAQLRQARPRPRPAAPLDEAMPRGA